MIDEPPYRAIAESTYDLETWVDETGAVRWVNRAAERILGVSADACVAMPSFPLPLVHEADRGIVQAVLERAARGESGNDIEFRIAGPDGRPRWVSVSFQPLVDDAGRSRGYRSSVRDIELRKEAERRLAEAERAAARVAAERMQLLATLSHELRTPIHCVAGFAELLLESRDEARSRRFLELIADQSSGALRLVEDLLHFAAGTVREASLRRAPFDLDAIVSAQVDALRHRASEGVALRFDGRLGPRRRRVGDADRVRQIVANLVGNALRFTERGEVSVSLREVDDGADGLVELQVRDTGIGMSADVIERVRRPFVQADTRGSDGRGGVGLGLAIVDDLATRLGGALTLTSDEGRGTTATVRLRLPRATTNLAGEFGSPPSSVRRLRVLVVDDVAASRELLAALFETAGIAPTLAPSGEKALEACAREVPDLVVLDYHMPGLDGLETARRIGELARRVGRRPYIVVLTADVVAEGIHPEVDAWRNKPLRRAELLELLGRVAVTRDEPDLDPVPMDELDAVLDASGRSILVRTGPGLVSALVDGARRLLEPSAGDDPSEVAHQLKGVAATLGERAIERLAARLEVAPGDAGALEELGRRIEPAARSIAARIAAGRPSA